MWYNIKRFIYTIRPLLWVPGLVVSTVYGIIPILNKISSHMLEKTKVIVLGVVVVTVLSFALFGEEICDRWGDYRG